MIKVYGFFLILSALFIAYHMYVAPMVDENGKVNDYVREYRF